MALEIPGIYIRTDLPEVYVFDHVTVETVKQTDRDILLKVTNPTAYDAIVTVLAEDGEQAARPLGDNAFLGWKDKIRVKAGKTVMYKVRK